MISAEEARKMTSKEDKSRLRKLKFINESIERKIKDAARREKFHVQLSVLAEFEKEVVSSLKEAGYKVATTDDYSSWCGNYFEIDIHW